MLSEYKRNRKRGRGLNGGKRNKKKEGRPTSIQPKGYAVRTTPCIGERRGEKRGDSRSPAQNQFNEYNKRY